MDRRTFLETIAAASAGLAILPTVPGLIPSAKAYSRPVQDSRLGPNSGPGPMEVREVPLNLEDTPELKPIGGFFHLEVLDLQRDIIVVHLAKDKYTAVDIKCKHRGCDVSYDGEVKKFVCPCHGSEYDVYGRILKGPATTPLSYYHTEVRGEEIIVTVYGSDDAVPANSVRPAPDTVSMPPLPHDSTSHSDTIIIQK